MNTTTTPCCFVLLVFFFVCQGDTWLECQLSQRTGQRAWYVLREDHQGTYSVVISGLEKFRFGLVWSGLASPGRVGFVRSLLAWWASRGPCKLAKTSNSCRPPASPGKQNVTAACLKDVLELIFFVPRVILHAWSCIGCTCTVKRGLFGHFV